MEADQNITDTDKLAISPKNTTPGNFKVARVNKINTINTKLIAAAATAQFFQPGMVMTSPSIGYLGCRSALKIPQ